MTMDPAAGAADARLAEELLEALGLFRRQVRRAAGRPWPLQSLSSAQAELVRLVRRRPGTSVAEAAAELGLAANTVSTLVRQLTDQGLLRRTADEADRRVARLELTAPARRRVEQWRDRRTALAGSALATMSATDRAALARAVPLIAQLAGAIARSEPAGGGGDA